MTIKKISVFPHAQTTKQKVDITSLTLALATVSKSDEIKSFAESMLDGMYGKSQDRAFRRANALIAVLRAHD